MPGGERTRRATWEVRIIWITKLPGGASDTDKLEGEQIANDRSISKLRTPEPVASHARVHAPRAQSNVL
jgi:hypothetical protein